ncbi:hypothetical protein EIN_063220 [Entamoeba invadens IP1]|uniref:hypothetical protein n=1 Tax=Entamoeba invadens IP1 TaxID=370355 RepID=UPI0002C3CFE4|nr:hypothetical protein EIN_063220 [Entamoeba invadens IP1]ELP93597.1 hypothetical protein EIN_063220 [Entamoeba invadens IP1]|eukprot:XP_004260368.1 hypothetical protein EIN_063220 [Entamoeba invadens IP1]
MNDPVVQVETVEKKPVFRLSNYRMIVHAILLSVVSCLYGGVPTTVLLLIGGLMIYDNVNRNTLSFKAAIPFTVLLFFFFLSIFLNVLLTMEKTINTLLTFVSLLLYTNLYIICVAFNFDLVKEFGKVTKENLKIVLNIFSSTLGFMTIPVTTYAVVYFVPTLEMYTPLLFVFVHFITSPKGDDPILISFASMITLIASIFTYLETEQMFIIVLPMALYLIVLTPHLNFLVFASVPLFVASCTMLVTNDMIFFILSGVIAVIFVLSLMKQPTIIESSFLFLVMSAFCYLIIERTGINQVMIIILAVGISLIAFRLRFAFEPIVFVSAGSAALTLFLFLYTNFHYISFHITRFIIFNMDLHTFTVIYGIFAAYTLVLPFLMMKIPRSVFSGMMMVYSFGLATIEYIVASRRNGVFYTDTYCLATAIILSLVAYLMFKTKKIYLTSFAVIISFQIAKLSMFVFPRYLSIFSIAVFLSTIIIRHSYHPKVATDSLYFIVNQFWNFAASLAISATFVSTLHVIYIGTSPTYLQTVLEALFLMCVLSTHECYVLNNGMFVIPFTGCFVCGISVLVSLGAESSVDQLLIFFIVCLMVFTSSTHSYSIGKNLMTRVVFEVSLAALFSHYLVGFLPDMPIWYPVVLFVPALCGIIITAETICYNQMTIKFLLPLYGVMVVCMPISTALTLLVTINMMKLRSIASVLVALHFTLHVCILIANNVQQKKVMKGFSYNTLMTVLSGPWSICMGIFLHYFILNGSSLAAVIFLPLIELVVIENYIKLNEYKKSAVVVFAIIVTLPVLTVSSALKYGFNIYVLTTYAFVIVWNFYFIDFAFWLFRGKSLLPFTWIAGIVQFGLAVVILMFTTNDLYVTECFLALVIVPISLYMKWTVEPEDKESLEL